MDQPAAHSHRRLAAPDASSSPLPSPPPPLHPRLLLPLPDARPPLPPPPPTSSLPLPWALLPPKKRRVLHPPCKAATPIPPPPPPQSSAPATPVPSAETLALPAPSPLPPVADSGLLTPPPPPVSEEDAPPCARRIPSANPKKPSTPPPAPDAAAKSAPTRKVRKVVRKVIVKKVVPKGTFAARKAAAAVVASDGAGKSTGESTTDKPANDHNVATDVSVGKEQSKIVLHRPLTNCNASTASPAAEASESGGETPNDKPKNDQHAATDDSVYKEQDADGTVVEKLATDCNAVAVQAAAGSSKSERETPTGKLTNDVQGMPAAKSAGKEHNVKETTVEKPATNCIAVAMREAPCKEAAVESLTEQTLARKPAIDCDAQVGEGAGISERQRTSMKEVFIGGLDRDAKEEDVRAVFGKAGEITQVRMIMDRYTRRNKGYCFVRYREAMQAKNAIAKFGKVKICGKFCRTAAPVGNDSISLGNNNKKWKKEDVKSIFVEGIPSSWGQAKLTEIFKNYGKIEHVFLSRNTQSSKKRVCACIKYLTHEATILCLESFDNQELTDNGSKVNMKVSLSKPVQKSKQNKEHSFRFSENDKTVGKSDTFQTAGDKKSSTNHTVLHVPRELATWRHGHTVPAPIQDHRATYSGEKRPCSTLDGYSSDRMRSYSRPRRGSSTSTTSTLSDDVLAPAITRSPLPSCHDTNRFPEGIGSYYGVTRSSISSQIRQVGAHQLLHHYGSGHPPKSKGGAYKSNWLSMRES